MLLPHAYFKGKRVQAWWSGKARSEIIQTSRWVESSVRTPFERGLRQETYRYSHPLYQKRPCGEIQGIVDGQIF
jgi:hypothetical protein